MKDARVLPGIRVDKGTVELDGTNGETIIEGLDRLDSMITVDTYMRRDSSIDVRDPMAVSKMVEDHTYRKIQFGRQKYYKGRTNGVVMTRGYDEHGQLGSTVTKADYRKRLQWHGSVARVLKFYLLHESV
ncbi:aldolase superfamily protein [Tanacetum coccineum]